MREEDKIQSECAQWFWNEYPSQRRMLVCINNNSQNALKGALNKAMGVVRGPSDMFLILPQRIIFIEFKTQSGVQKPEQIDFMNKVQDRGHLYLVLRSASQFKTLIHATLGSS